VGRRRIDSWMPSHLVALRAEVRRLRRLVSDKRRSGMEQRLEEALIAYRAELEKELERRRACTV
jgi:hypothetical protein